MYCASPPSLTIYNICKCENMVAMKCQSLCLSDKVDILKQIQSPGVTQASLAKMCGVSTSQVSCIVKAKGELLKQFDNGGNHERKRQRSCMQMLKEKATKLASALFIQYLLYVMQCFY